MANFKRQIKPLKIYRTFGITRLKYGQKDKRIYTTIRSFLIVKKLLTIHT